MGICGVTVKPIIFRPSFPTLSELLFRSAPVGGSVSSSLNSAGRHRVHFLFSEDRRRAAEMNVIT